MKLSLKFIIPTILVFAVVTAFTATLTGMVVKDIINFQTHMAYQGNIDNENDPTVQKARLLLRNYIHQ